MVLRWIITDHHIAIDAGEELLHPDASEVFSFVVGEHENAEIPNPMEQLTELHFSTVGSPVKCEVNYSEEKHTIYLELFTLRKNRRYEIDIVGGQIIDHAVANGEWFYINNDIEGLQSLLTHAGIERCGEITIGQYIKIIKQELFTDSKEIINNIRPDDVSQLMVPQGMVPSGINATLYAYQKTGYLWMRNMIDASGGCILGDEMGLGKTLQIITLFQSLLLRKRGPLLVVAPVSLLENWRRECGKFAPDIDAFIHHGSKRTGIPSVLSAHDVVIISYNTAVSDLSLLRMIEWECVVLDEAQNIKNPYSERSKSVKAITRKTGIAVTGTPFENHITDIWSLVDFCVPGLLGSLGVFKDKVSDDVLGAELIEPVISPIMIRRLVNDVAKDLPEKIIIPQPIVMSEEERFHYEQFRMQAKQLADGGSAISLALLQKLRMFCTHQFLCDKNLKGEDPYSVSIKYQRFCEILEEIFSRDEKVIVFTSYKKMFELFCSDTSRRFGINIECINGDTPVKERQEIVDRFNNCKGSAMLALNPRAAGTGLNITGANHVIHYNLEWNPSLEDQASARAYRRGQKKNVFIYRLYYIDTVEQIVNERIERKREIASVAVKGTDGADERNDILRALEMAPKLH